MSNNFGIKLGIEGEKEFKNALRDINQSFKVLGSEMNLVTSQFDKNDQSLAAITSRNQVLNKEIDTQRDKVNALEKALANASSSFGETDKRTQAWQIQLNNANADLNRMEKELSENNKALDTSGSEFSQAEKQAYQFGDEVKNAADKADDAGSRFDKLGGILKSIGVATGMAFAAIGAAAIGAGKALVDMSVGAASYADEILTMQSVTGMSTESLQAYKYAAELVDVSMETLTGSMSKQIKSMANARDGSDKFAKAYEKLGISVADSNGNLRDSDTVYWEAIDALGAISNETERDAIAMQIFGKSAQALNPLIAQGSAGIAALTEEAKNMGAVMSEESLAALGKFDDSMQRLQSGAAAAKNVLGTVLLPQLQVLANDGVGLLGDFTKGMSEADGDWSKISEVVGETVGGLVGMIMENMPKIISLGLDIIKSIGSAIIENLPMLIQAAVEIVMTLLKGLIDALPQLAEGALQLVLSLLNGIIENLPALVEGAIMMIITLAKGIGDALPELIPKIVDAVILIVQTLLDNMDMILEAAFQIIMGLAKGLIAALPGLIEKLPAIITSIIDFITENLPMIIEMGIKLIVMLAAGLIQAIPQLLAKLPEIVSALVNGLGKAADAVVEIGANIVKGIWNGIVSMVDWIKKKIGEFVGGIVDGIKGLLGIQSPSRVFAGIGKYMAQGLGEGFSNAMNSISREMENVIPTRFEPEITYTGSAHKAKSASGITVVQNIYTPQTDYVKQQREAAKQFKQIARGLA